MKLLRHSFMFIIVSQSRSSNSKITWEAHIASHLTNADLDKCHVVYGVFYIICELAEIVGLDSNAVVAMTIVAHIEAKDTVVRCYNNESTDLSQGIQRDELVSFNKLIVSAFVVVDQTFAKAILQAEEELDGVTQVLPYGGVAES